MRARILSGEIGAGTAVVESDVATELGISRTPVRHGLQLLFDEGLLEIGSRRQLVVRDMSPEHQREIFLLRNALERLSVSEACRVMDIEDVDYLRLILIRQRRAAQDRDASRFLDLDEEFHVTIATGAQLPLLTKFLNQLRAFIRLMGVEAVSHGGRMDEVLVEHERIINAIEKRDEEAALKALADHLRLTESTLLRA